MILNQQQLDEAIAAMPGEKVTMDYIKSRVYNVQYKVDGTLTICVVTLDNGYKLTGTSACVDPMNFNKDVGETIAFNNAISQAWPLFGFLLAERRHLIAKKGQLE